MNKVRAMRLRRRSATPSGSSPYGSRAKLAAAIAGELLVILIILATVFLPAIFAGA